MKQGKGRGATSDGEASQFIPVPKKQGASRPKHPQFSKGIGLLGRNIDNDDDDNESLDMSEDGENLPSLDEVIDSRDSQRNQGYIVPQKL